MGEQALNIFKARSDKREYSSYVLSNELRVLLVSDPDTDKAAASMDVKVGSFSDPDDLPGLAHFLEHMLFYASEKYPLEDDFMKFLAAHGGRTNAYTSTENTNFQFDVNAKHLPEALDRFAQFFICPTMSPDATLREINAIDNEYSLGRNSDSKRLYQLSQHLTSHAHPFHKFSTGNLETLHNRPTAKSIDTREVMLKFYEKLYSANVMCLVVYGREKLSELRDLVDQTFSTIKNKEIQAPCFEGKPCLPEHLKIIVRTVPVRQQHVLQLQWPALPGLKHYKCSPCRLIGHLIGHESEGSIFALLNSLGWSTSLFAGEERGSSGYSFFNVVIGLTDQGNEQVENILSIIFKYIHLILEQGITLEHFDEVNTMDELNFHYQDKYAPFSYVTYLASNMQKYPLEDWLIGRSFAREYDSLLIRKQVELLTPGNLRVIHASKKFEGKTTAIEPWYGIPYSVEIIPDNLVKDLELPSSDERLYLPKANPFIPSDFSLQASDSKVKEPYVLKSSKLSKLWFKPDCAFKMPKGEIVISIICPKSVSSIDYVNLSSIFVRLLLDDLNEFAYYAEIAGLWYYISTKATGFEVMLGGYNHKLSILLEKIASRFVSLDVKEDRFHIIKEKYTKHMCNYNLNSTQCQASEYLGLLLSHKAWPVNDHLEALHSLQPTDLRHFIKDILSRLTIECYIAGNFSESNAIELFHSFQQAFIQSAKPLFTSNLCERRTLKMKSQSDFYFAQAALNGDDENSALLDYFQIGRDEPRLNVLIAIFVTLAKEEAFHQLRTIEQLGYNVSLSHRRDWGVQGVQFIIQSNVKDPKFLDTKVESFLESFEIQLKNLTDGQFKKNVNALISTYLEKHKNLYEECNFYWTEIDAGTYEFDWKLIEVEVLKDIKKEELINFFEEYVKSGSPMRKKLSIQVYGKFHKAELSQVLDRQEEVKYIKDIFKFKCSQELYPSLGS